MKQNKIYFLFGEVGAGKSYCGEKLAESLNCSYFDGDEIFNLPQLQYLQEKIVKKQNFNLVDLNQITIAMISEIKKRCYNPSGYLVVSQAMYRKLNRNYIKSQFAELYFVEIKASSWQHFCQLWNRGISWIWYGLKNHWYFQSHHGFYIFNKKDSLPLISVQNYV